MLQTQSQLSPPSIWSAQGNESLVITSSCKNLNYQIFTIIIFLFWMYMGVRISFCFICVVWMHVGILHVWLHSHSFSFCRCTHIVLIEWRWSSKAFLFCFFHYVTILSGRGLFVCMCPFVIFVLLYMGIDVKDIDVAFWYGWESILIAFRVVPYSVENYSFQ